LLVGALLLALFEYFSVGDIGVRVMCSSLCFMIIMYSLVDVAVLDSVLISILPRYLRNEKLVLVGAFSVFGDADTGKPVQILGYISKYEVNLGN